MPAEPPVYCPRIYSWQDDVLATTIYEGTSQIQKLIIGRQLSGENTFV